MSRDCPQALASCGLIVCPGHWVSLGMSAGCFVLVSCWPILSRGRSTVPATKQLALAAAPRPRQLGLGEEPQWVSLDSNRQRARQSTNIRPSQAIHPYLVAVTDLSYTPPTRASLELPRIIARGCVCVCAPLSLRPASHAVRIALSQPRSNSLSSVRPAPEWWSSFSTVFPDVCLGGVEVQHLSPVTRERLDRGPDRVQTYDPHRRYVHTW